MINYDEYRTIYSLGYGAYCNDLDRESNPYPKRSEQNDAWNEGWNDASSEALNDYETDEN